MRGSSFGFVALLAVFAPVAMGQEPPGTTELASMLPADAASSIPWVAYTVSVISGLVLLARTVRDALNQLHAIAKDCQPTVRVLHAYEACPSCGAAFTKPEGEETKDTPSASPPRTTGPLGRRESGPLGSHYPPHVHPSG